MPSSETLLDHLRTRRSSPAAALVPPAPDEAALADILTIAARVPDHGKLAPWRFVLVEDGAVAAFRERLMGFWRDDHPDASEEQAEVERGKRPGAPLLIVLVSTAGEHPKIPVWEQELSVGAAGLNLLHAVHGHGFSAQWLTGWPAYDGRVADLLELTPPERVAGFFYVGTARDRPAERDRPALDAIVTRWVP